MNDQFYEYLYGNSFDDVYTDNNPLTYVLTSANPRMLVDNGRLVP